MADTNDDEVVDMDVEVQKEIEDVEEIQDDTTELSDADDTLKKTE